MAVLIDANLCIDFIRSNISEKSKDICTLLYKGVYAPFWVDINHSLI